MSDGYQPPRSQVQPEKPQPIPRQPAEKKPKTSRMRFTYVKDGDVQCVMCGRVPIGGHVKAVTDVGALRVSRFCCVGCVCQLNNAMHDAACKGRY